MLSQLNLVLTLTMYFCETWFGIILSFIFWSQLNLVLTLTTYFCETWFGIILSFIFCSQYCSYYWDLCQWLRAFLRWNCVALVVEFYVMMIIQVCWDMALYCGVISSVYVKGLYSIHCKGLKVPENVSNCMPINILLHPRRLVSQYHWCKKVESCIILDVHAYTAWYMEVKTLQKSDNSVHSLGPSESNLVFCFTTSWQEYVHIITVYCWQTHLRNTCIVCTV